MTFQTVSLALLGNLRQGGKYHAYVIECQRIGTFLFGGLNLWAVPDKEPIAIPGEGVIALDLIKCDETKLKVLAKMKFFSLKSLREISYRDVTVLIPISENIPANAVKILTGDFLQQ